jgi:hypothetical protein
LSGGVPRVINRLCDRALRYGYSKKEATIDADIVESANPEMEHEATAAAAPSFPAPIASVPVAAAPPPPAPAPVVVAAPPPAAPAPPALAPPVATIAPPPVAPPAAAAPPPIEQADVAARLVGAAPLAHAAPPSEPAASAIPKDPPDQLEAWLREIDTQPTIDLDWRQRWAPTNAIAAPPPPLSRSGVKLRIPAGSNPYRHTHTDRIRRRWVGRFFRSAIALILLSGAIIVGPPSIAASLDILSQIDDQFTAPPWPMRPPSPRHSVGAPARLAPPADPLDDVR